MKLSKILKSNLHETFISKENKLYIYHNHFTHGTENKPLNIEEVFEYYKLNMQLENERFNIKNHCSFNSFITNDRLYARVRYMLY